MLSEIFAKRKGRTSIKMDGYFPAYDRHLAPFRDKPINVWEIGVYKGGSLEMWRDYFPLANVIGIDVQPEYEFTDRRIGVFIGSQDDADFLRRLRSEYPPTIVIDDGCHILDKMVVSFETLWPVPLYVVEDAGAFVEYAKTRVGDAHVFFYNELVIFEPRVPIRKVDSGRKPLKE